MRKISGVWGLAPIKTNQPLVLPLVSQTQQLISRFTLNQYIPNYFYVWMKRTLGLSHPALFGDKLANADDEAIMNVARFKDMGRKAKELAVRDYENKLAACFAEMFRVLTDDGVLTVMFTHKQIEAWDTLGSGLVRVGFQIDSSWPIHTESEVSVHQSKKNSAGSTIMLVCRKREKPSEPVWWEVGSDLPTSRADDSLFCRLQANKPDALDRRFDVVRLNLTDRLKTFVRAQQNALSAGNRSRSIGQIRFHAFGGTPSGPQ